MTWSSCPMMWPVSKRNVVWCLMIMLADGYVDLCLGVQKCGLLNCNILDWTTSGVKNVTTVVFTHTRTRAGELHTVCLHTHTRTGELHVVCLHTHTYTGWRALCGLFTHTHGLDSYTSSVYTHTDWGTTLRLFTHAHTDWKTTRSVDQSDATRRCAGVLGVWLASPSFCQLPVDLDTKCD